MSSLSEKIHKLNDMFVQGKALEAFEQFYADDIVMQENEQEPTSAKRPTVAAKRSLSAR
jgi:hypothetical protein